MSTTGPGKKIREVCLALGSPYEIKTIDLEYVVYRDLGNGYDIEVSGLDNQRHNFEATIYVWEISGTKRTIETIKGISSVDELKHRLDDVVRRYLPSHP